MPLAFGNQVYVNEMHEAKNRLQRAIDRGASKHEIKNLREQYTEAYKAVGVDERKRFPVGYPG